MAEACRGVAWLAQREWTQLYASPCLWAATPAVLPGCFGELESDVDIPTSVLCSFLSAEDKSFLGKSYSYFCKRPRAKSNKAQLEQSRYSRLIAGWCSVGTDRPSLPRPIAQPHTSRAPWVPYPTHSAGGGFLAVLLCSSGRPSRNTRAF